MLFNRFSPFLKTRLAPFPDELELEEEEELLDEEEFVDDEELDDSDEVELLVPLLF